MTMLDPHASCEFGPISATHVEWGHPSIILYKYGADTHSSSADLLLLSRAARLDRSIPLLIAHATAASNGTASCSDRASRSFAAGCAHVQSFTDPICGRILPFDASADSSVLLAPHHVWICLSPGGTAGTAVQRYSRYSGTAGTADRRCRPRRVCGTAAVPAVPRVPVQQVQQVQR